MRRSLFRTLAAAVFALVLSAGPYPVGGAQAATTPTGLAVNQTQGFGSDKILAFTYTQQFACVVEPFDDRDYGNHFAAVYPAQFSHPQCQIGAPSKIDPTGAKAFTTDKLYVIVPFFETDPTQPAFTPQLGKTLQSVFGMVPDAFKLHPGVAVQCPEPGYPLTQHKGSPGTCTMHPTGLDLGPVLAALGKIPPKQVVNLPLVNHSHILAAADINVPAEWWQVIVVLVTDRAAWPNAEGTSGVTSLAKLRVAQKNGQASGDVSSNFFLFFSSMDMAHMH